MSSLSTHVLDTTSGLPAPGIPVQVERQTNTEWSQLAQAMTDADGRARFEVPLDSGVHRVTFDLEEAGRGTFYPYAQIVFRVDSARPHYHIPLLLSPYGYTTYRGS